MQFLAVGRSRPTTKIIEIHVHRIGTTLSWINLNYHGTGEFALISQKIHENHYGWQKQNANQIYAGSIESPRGQ